MSIPLKKLADLEKLRVANRYVALTLEYLRDFSKVGMTLKEINQAGEDFIFNELKARPSFKGLYGFPAGVCTSLNEVIIHGIPTETKVKEGDILGLDIGVEYEGWYGDAAISLGMGKVSETNEKLIECAKNTLLNSISEIEVGMRFKELSAILEKHIRSYGFVPLKNFCGHGIGQKPHEEPEIPNYVEHGSLKSGPKIKNGMVFCLEPMICQENQIPKILDDKWSVVSEDGLFGSHYEHTVAVFDNKVEILSVV
ncbi:MAG: Methionine aminopeptidase (EC [uncultured Campylobacterales bacterium]|uniref:Methionine aminopeptidase n=1 Tax=uncultured Campylobacterales bacterium TaxID=352960 RepID=A0A6S6S2J5_9BACT|nr:MAG: Methionine aminopeptidase (EC [uncultured Campylobacterales bacterium]